MDNISTRTSEFIKKLIPVIPKQIVVKNNFKFRKSRNILYFKMWLSIIKFWIELGN